MQNSVAPKLQTFMEALWLRVFSLFKYHMISMESVLLTKVHVEIQIVCSKMHQRGNVKKGHLIMTHSTLIDLKREFMVLILASSVNWAIIDFYMGHPNK